MLSCDSENIMMMMMSQVFHSLALVVHSIYASFYGGQTLEQLFCQSCAPALALFDCSNLWFL